MYTFDPPAPTPRALTVEIVTVGDELNRGEIIDSNAAWLGEQLTAMGGDVRYRQGVNDRVDDMTAAFLLAAGRAQVVVVTGGLGPTSDDRTVDVAAALLGVEPVEEAAHAEKVRRRFAERGLALTPNNLRQVRVPAGAAVLENHKGLAPGFQIQIGAAALFFMPGVPVEMKPMFLGEVTPRLRPLFGEQAPVARRTYRVIGLGESHIDHRLRDLLEGQPSSLLVTLHYRLAFPEVLVTLVVRGAGASAQSYVDVLDGEVRKRLGGALYGTGAAGLPEVVGESLRRHGATLATAESCTGGMIGELLTAVPGSSEYFLGGVISYANAVKQGVLGVREETLAAHGAVSRACVEEMAAGVRRVTGATYGVAVSGVAGPGGGSPDKPVGTVHLGVAGPGGTRWREIRWPGERDQVRRIAAYAALNLLHKVLQPERDQGPPDRL